MAHGLIHEEVEDGVGESACRVFGGDDANGVGFFHGFDDLAEVFEGRAHDDGDAEAGGLERVMASAGDEAAADEGDFGEGVDGGEVAEGVEEDGLARLVWDGFACEKLGCGGDAVLEREGVRVAETVRMAGGQDEDDCGPELPDVVHGSENKVFLREGAAG